MGRSYRDLVAWQKAMEFVTSIYRATTKFPHDEAYGLRLRSGEQRFRFQATLQRGKAGCPKMNLGISLVWHVDR